MDNEALKELKQAILKNKINYQLTPPHMHRINAAERSIHTFEKNSIYDVSSVDPYFPISKWGRMLDQSEITLKLTKLIIHANTSYQYSWVLHG